MMGLIISGVASLGQAAISGGIAAANNKRQHKTTEQHNTKLINENMDLIHANAALKAENEHLKARLQAAQNPPSLWKIFSNPFGQCCCTTPLSARDIQKSTPPTGPQPNSDIVIDELEAPQPMTMKWPTSEHTISKENVCHRRRFSQPQTPRVASDSPRGFSRSTSPTPPPIHLESKPVTEETLETNQTAPFAPRPKNLRTPTLLANETPPAQKFITRSRHNSIVQPPPRRRSSSGSVTPRPLSPNPQHDGTPTSQALLYQKI